MKMPWMPLERKVGTMRMEHEVNVGIDAAKTSDGIEDLEDMVGKLKVSSLADHEKLGNLIGTKLASANTSYILEFLKTVIAKVDASFSWCTHL